MAWSMNMLRLNDRLWTCWGYNGMAYEHVEVKWQTLRTCWGYNDTVFEHAEVKTTDSMNMLGLQWQGLWTCWGYNDIIYQHVADTMTATCSRHTEVLQQHAEVTEQDSINTLRTQWRTPWRCVGHDERLQNSSSLSRPCDMIESDSQHESTPRYTPKERRGGGTEEGGRWQFSLLCDSYSCCPIACWILEQTSSSVTRRKGKEDEADRDRARKTTSRHGQLVS